MSSSRSVAAARARRAGETSLQRPRSSIGSFSQIPPAAPPQNYPHAFPPAVGKFGPSAVKNTQFSQQQQQQQQIMQQQQPNQNQPLNKPKISIGNAIALVSLRLGRLEQLLQDSDGELPGNIGSGNEQKVLDNVINRLVLLENKPAPVSVATVDHSEAVARLSRENRDLKNNLQKVMRTFASFVQETNDKFLDYDAAFVDLEKKIQDADSGFASLDAIKDDDTVLPEEPELSKTAVDTVVPLDTNTDDFVFSEADSFAESFSVAEDEITQGSSSSASKPDILSEEIKNELKNISVV